MITVSNLSKTYSDTLAVDNLSFTVNENEILGLVGPNGAGKTTTMRSMIGVIPLQKGSINIDSYDLKNDPVEAKRLMAFVPAEPRLFDHLTVFEHLQFFARLYLTKEQPFDKQKISEKCEKLIIELNLEEKRNKLANSLSRGMVQKLMIGTALIHEPKFLIMDEPFTGLDPMAIRDMRSMLRQRADNGTAILISSHLLSMVEDIIDRVLIIQKGKKVALGTLNSLKDQFETLHQHADLEEIFLHVTNTKPK